MPASRTIPEEVRQRVLGLRAAGLTRQQAADRLVRDRVPGANGRVRWTATAIRRLEARRGPAWMSPKEQQLAAELEECRRRLAEAQSRTPRTAVLPGPRTEVGKFTCRRWVLNERGRKERRCEESFASSTERLQHEHREHG